MSWNEAQINEIFLIGQVDAMRERDEGVLVKPVLADDIMEKWWNRGYESQWRLFRAISSEDWINSTENKLDEILAVLQPNNAIKPTPATSLSIEDGSAE